MGTLAGILSVGFIVSNTPDKTAYKSNSISKIQLQEEFTPKVEKEIHSPISVVEPIEAKHVFEQGNNEFLIGFVNEFAENNGKVINTWLDASVGDNSKVWLEYDLYGVSDYSSVCMSLNDQLSTGGNLVKKSNEWTSQREQINPKDVKQGLNIIRFNIPDNAKYNYVVKNVRLRVEDENSGREIVLNKSGETIYNDKYVYIQGFVRGAGSEDAVIRIDGNKIQTHNGVFESILEKTSINSPTTIEAEYKDGEILSKSVTVNQSEEYDFYYPELGFSQFISKTYTPASSIDFSHLGLNLSGSANSIDCNTTFSAISLRSQDMAPMENGLINVTKYCHGYRLLPDGSKFQKDLRIKIKYDTALLPAGFAPEDIFAFYYDEKAGTWIPLERDTIDIENCEVISFTNHFTDFISGIIQSPEMPEIQSFTPTSIKNLAVADPFEGVRLINPPVANNMGTANTELPIDIPAGRGGMQPNLSIQYNSSGGNSWMGLGWNISVPEISVDTRWGVPRYDSQNETESYLYAGEELTPQVQRSNYKPREADKEFFELVRGSFSKIIRYGNNPNNYHWLVIDKSGTKYYFGNTGDSKIGSDKGIA
ncbi:MAG: hypothetical protein GX935_00055, partial [Erysipelotrichia bacterium]|nr:hypothetical protein [Erysipelotrichia bacterium]